LRSIVVAWNLDGLPTTHGRPWQLSTFRDLMTQPRLAGLRVHQGAVIGKASWPAIVDLDTHERIIAMVNARRIGARREMPKHYLLTGGLARCGSCGSGLRVNRPMTGQPRYVCPSKHQGQTCPAGVSIVVGLLDETARAEVMAHVDGPDFRRALQRAAANEKGRAGDLSSFTDDIAKARARLPELGDMYASGEMTRAEYGRLTTQIQTRIDRAQSELASHERPAQALHVVGKGSALAEAWPLMTLDERRTIVGAVLDHVLVAPGRGAQRVQPVWRF
jgi:hypothetical protein